jgi:hypothetical protein
VSNLLKLGLSEITGLANFCHFNVTSLGHLITNSSLIRETHNSFTSSSPFSIAQNPLAQHKKQDAYHFVTYVPVLGQLWELDGLRNAPIKHGPVDEGKGEGEGEGWVKKAREVIEKRIATYPEGSVSVQHSPMAGGIPPQRLADHPLPTSSCSTSSASEPTHSRHSAVNSRPRAHLLTSFPSCLTVSHPRKLNYVEASLRMAFADTTAFLW